MYETDGILILKNMDIIQINKFSKLHNAKDIVFCKTDFLDSDFRFIKSIENDVILISGNSDYPIDDNKVENMPNNIKVWFAQNVLTNHEKLIPIPIGLENKTESLRAGHGIGYFDRVSLKEKLLSRNIKKTPTKKIYANFNIETNKNHRDPIKSICIESDHIDWEEPSLSLEQFFNKVLEYEMIVCPAGNGVDTHRLWEVLYSNRIPITIKTGEYKIYELYENFPIVILDSKEQLFDSKLLEQKYEDVKSKSFDKQMLDFSFWEQKIISKTLKEYR